MAKSSSNSGGERPKRKSCFVIMPISDPEGYPKGHFSEVYQQLIKPAVENCGFDANRADEVAQSNMIHFDVVSKVVNADLCICDLSARNPNVFFELGIRQAFDKPTVLIKDDETSRVFDVQDFRDVTYSKDLRISATLDKRKDLEEAMLATMGAYESDSGDVFSLVKLLGLREAASQPKTDTDPADARFELLSRQIDVIQSQISSLTSSLRGGRIVPRSLIRREPFGFSNDAGDMHVRLESDGGIVLLDDNARRAKNFESFEEFISYLQMEDKLGSFTRKQIDSVREKLS